MSALWVIVRRIWSREWWSLLRGTLLAIAVLAAGVALLGLSGWFITAAGMAGLAGIGIAFDVFRPSAAVRFLALGRTVTRYGERMLTHDATLRSLATLRVELLKGLAALPFARAGQFRAPEEVNRLTIDVDALDGVALRLVIPLLSAVVVLAGTVIALWVLVHPSIALIALACLLPAGVIAFAYILAASLKPARLAHRAQDRFRGMVMELLRGRGTLAVSGNLVRYRDRTLAADREARSHSAKIDRIERTGGLVISLAMTVALAAILFAGYHLVQSGTVLPAFVALAFFAVLALGETVLPLRRGFSELGRMTDAARRVVPLLDVQGRPQPPATVSALASAPMLEFDGVRFSYTGAGTDVVQNFRLVLRPGETVAMTGPSGGGKSTILNMAAGLLQPSGGEIRLEGIALSKWPEAELRSRIAMLPQRSALLSGTVLEALQMSRADVTESQAQEVVEAVALTGVIGPRGGLAMKIGESGSGLSGGERRRLALARALLRKPAILLLDEPTEGLDDATARRVLAGIRDYLPGTAILLASHRQAEREAADRCVTVCGNSAD